MLIIKIHNDGTGTDESANYNYSVFVNNRTIAHGRIEGHNRCDEWEELVARLLSNNTEKAKICTARLNNLKDGYGNAWKKTCPECKQDTMEIIRPGKVQCSECG